MYCWSCGTHLETPGRPCPRCGTHPPEPLRTGGGGQGDGSPAGAPPSRPGTAAPFGSPAPRERGAFLLLRGCPACGFRGEGIPYFRRAGNLALLAAATLFTYGVGGVVYWLLKRNDRVCPSCGLDWQRARPLGEEPPPAESTPPVEGRSPVTHGGPVPRGREATEGGLPRSGIGRRAVGTLVALLGLLMIGIGTAELEAVLLVVGGVTGLTGALTFGWGWQSLQRRREAILQRMQRRVLRLARSRAGRLTATEVATELDLTLGAAERVLLSLDDGFRIRSDVTEEGILVFDFPELQLRPPGGGRGDDPRSGPAPPLPG